MPASSARRGVADVVAPRSTGDRQGPGADSTDTYAFISPDKPDTVTLIANFSRCQQPDGGPNFYEFGDDVLYTINISNRGKGRTDLAYEFEFTTRVRDPKTYFYNTGPITSITDKTWNRPQTYTGTRVQGGAER